MKKNTRNIGTSKIKLNDKAMYVELMLSIYRDRRGRNRMIVGFIITYAINAYYH